MTTAAAAAAAATSTGNVKRIVAAFEFARLRRELERRRQRLEEWFTTTSVVPATPSATPSASLNSPATSTTSPPTTSTTPTSIDATTTLCFSTTAEPLQVLPARCSTPSIHQDTKCSEEWSFTTSPTTFINRKNYSSGRYTTTSTPATSSIILSGLDTDGLEAQNEFEELATRLGFKSWKVFSCGYVDVPMRQPWPPPVVLEMQNHGVQFRPMPWPSFSGYTVSGVQQTKAQPSVFDCSRSYYYDCLVVCQIGVCKVPCQLFRENVGTYCCLWASYVTTGLTQAFTSHTVVVFCSVNEYMVKLYISKEYLQHCIELYGMTMQVNGIKWQGIRQLQLSVGTYGYLQKMDDHFCIFSDRARVAALQSCFVKCCCRQWGTPWLSFTSCCNCVVNPLNGEKFVQVAEVRGTEIKPFVKESLSKCLQHGLHNPLKASERYLMYGDISVKAAHISEVIAKLIQRVSPNNYQQALLEVQVSQRLLKVDSRGSVVMEQMFRLLHKCGLPAEDLDFINSDGWTSCEPIVDYAGESQNCRQGSMSVTYLHPSSPAHGVEFLPLSKWPKPPWAQLTGIIVVRLNFQSLGVVLRCFNNQFTANGKSYNRFQPRQAQLYWCLYTNTWWNISLTESHSAHSVKWNISVPISVTTLKWSITWVFTDHEVIQSQPKILCKVQLLQISGNSLQMFSGGKIDLTAAKISGQADVLQYWQLLVELQSDWHFISSSMFSFKSKFADVHWPWSISSIVQHNSVGFWPCSVEIFQSHIFLCCFQRKQFLLPAIMKISVSVESWQQGECVIVLRHKAASANEYVNISLSQRCFSQFWKPPWQPSVHDLFKWRFAELTLSRQSHARAFAMFLWLALTAVMKESVLAMELTPEYTIQSVCTMVLEMTESLFVAFCGLRALTGYNGEIQSKRKVLLGLAIISSIMLQHVITLGFTISKKMEQSSLGASSLMDVWLNTLCCSSYVSHMRYVLLKLFIMKHMPTLAGNPMRVQLQCVTNQLDFMVLLTWTAPHMPTLFVTSFVIPRVPVPELSYFTSLYSRTTAVLYEKVTNTGIRVLTFYNLKLDDP